MKKVVKKALKQVSQMSDRDKERFKQCFNCKNLDTCVRDEWAEDENGLCVFYEFQNINSPYTEIINKILERRK